MMKETPENSSCCLQSDQTLLDEARTTRFPSPMACAPSSLTNKEKIDLIVSYSPWFGWFGRPVAVPIEFVGIFGHNIASLDMSRQDYAEAPTWSGAGAQPIPATETIQIGLTRH